MKTDDIIKARYHLNSFIGAGVFGEVWRAHDNVLDMDVAVKLYTSSDTTSISKLQQEYKNAFNLSHANILSPKHIDVTDGCPFITYNLCRAGSVRKLIGCSNEKTIWKIILDVSLGLQYLHKHSILHNNLKPENILITDDYSFVIADIALSKSTRATMSKESMDRYTSSIAYKAPEAMQGKTSSEKSDIWSLGAILFELITGSLPTESDFSRIDLLLSSRGISGNLREIISSCLNIEENNRPTASKLHIVAQDVLSSQTGETTNNDNNEKHRSSLRDIGKQHEKQYSHTPKTKMAPRNWFVTIYEWGLLLGSLITAIFFYGIGFDNAVMINSGINIPDDEVNSLYIDEYFVIGLMYTIKMLGEIMLLKRIRVGYIVSSSAVFCSTYAACTIGEYFEYTMLIVALATTASYMLFLWLVLLIRKNGYSQWQTMSRSINLSKHKWITWCLLTFIVLFLFCEILTF